MREYAFLMIDYETPEFIKQLHKQIPTEDLYTEENSDYYGLEKQTHVTLVPCLDNNIDLDDLKRYLQNIQKYEVMLTNISVFENPDYDVLKCDVKSNILFDTNANILKDYVSHSDYTDYRPHITIAYLKKGVGERYKKNILEPVTILKPKNFHFSYIDSNGEEKQIQFI